MPNQAPHISRLQRQDKKKPHLPPLSFNRFVIKYLPGILENDRT
jgi:hypothetical protein